MSVNVRALLILVVVGQTYGHGRLLEPPSRSSMWRAGFNTPHNYNDNALNCGGVYTQYYVNQGKCGVCGDPYNQPAPRDNEAGGKYGTGVITRTYSPGQEIEVRVEITANHLGWFEFRLCPHNDPSTPVTQACLDQNILQLADGSGTRYTIDSHTGYYDLKLKLPPGLTCSQCVFQWKWHAGNNFGTDDSGRSCVGCGNQQEEFYGCSDIAIGASAPVTTTASTPVTTTTSTSQPTSTSNSQPTLAQTTNHAGNCWAINAWQGNPDLHAYCQAVCPGDTCPWSYCACSSSSSTQPAVTMSSSTAAPVTTTASTYDSSLCHAIGLWSGYPHLERYCGAICPGSSCPQQYCSCSPDTTTTTATTTTATPSPTTTHTVPQTYTSTAQTTPAAPTHNSLCHGINAWHGNPELDRYCAEQCPVGNCPPSFCSCSVVATITIPTTAAHTAPPTTPLPVQQTTQCHAVGLWQGDPATDRWCNENCPQGVCPNYCSCGSPSAPSTSHATVLPTTPTTPPPTISVSSYAGCFAIGSWAGHPELDQWCTETCAQFGCDPQFCSCSKCHAINGWAGVPELDTYCETKCPQGVCPDQYCACDTPTGQPVVAQVAGSTPSQSSTLPTTQPTTPTPLPTTTTTTSTYSPGTNCHAINNWQGVADLDYWCQENCAIGNCPSVYCTCSP